MIEPIIPTGNRVILLEEFTGKGCTNCPKGSREIDNLLSLYGDNLVAVSIHAGFFADPAFFPVGQFDLRTSAGELLFELLGPNFGYPAGIVNRTEFNGFLQHSHTAWAAFAAEEITEPPRLEFSLQHTYDQDTRQLLIELNGLAKVVLPDEIRVSVMLTENGIIDAQDDAFAGGIVEEYVHNHVLRDVATSAQGDFLSASLDFGEQFSANFEMHISSEWDPKRCDIVAFLSMREQGSFVVLQAQKISLL